nr:uncharacterized protein LOC113711579 [Coffea arabica]
MALVIFITFLISFLSFDGFECKNLGGSAELINHNNEAISVAKTVYGDIYDCIDIYKQPAFNHPALSNHKIQFAGITVNADPGKKYGAAQAVINIYNPKVVGPGHYSSATIAIESGENQIQMGWIVHPQLYGDYRTRLYSSWTADNSRSTGCFNNNCPGFVVLSRDMPLDYAFPSISQPEEQQYDSLIGLALVNGTGEWLLVFEFNTVIGYWPNSILPNLASGAETIRWGGQVFTPPSDDTSSQMGSGLFRNGQRRITCYMRQVTYDETISPDKSSLQTHDSRCYYEGYNFYDKDSYWAYSFLFGGKGGKDGVTCIY